MILLMKFEAFNGVIEDGIYGCLWKDSTVLKHFGS